MIKHLIESTKLQNLNSFLDCEALGPGARSEAEVVLTTLLLEQVELLEGLESVDGKDEVTIGSHTKTGHSILELDIEEDGGGNVVGVLLGEGLVRAGLGLGDHAVSVGLDEAGGGGGSLSGVLVARTLGVGDAEGHVLVDLVEVAADSGEELVGGVDGDLGSLLAGGFVGSDVSVRDGLGALIRESLEEGDILDVVAGNGRSSEKSDESHYE